MVRSDEKKPEFAVAARSLKHEIRHYLGISGVTDVRELIRYAREKSPAFGFSSDLIVGFPTETDADFEETMHIIEEVKYDNLYTFIYIEIFNFENLLKISEITKSKI